MLVRRVQSVIEVPPATLENMLRAMLENRLLATLENKLRATLENMLRATLENRRRAVLRAMLENMLRVRWVNNVPVVVWPTVVVAFPTTVEFCVFWAVVVTWEGVVLECRRTFQTRQRYLLRRITRRQLPFPFLSS